MRFDRLMIAGNLIKRERRLIDVRTFDLLSVISLYLLVAGMLIPLPTVAAQDDDRSANDLLRAVVENELKAQAADHSHWSYESTSPASGTGCKETHVIQTKDGEIGRVVAVDGRPLTSAEQENEDRRIQRFIDNPQQQRKRQREESEDDAKTERIFKVLPQMVIATYGQKKGDLVELDFKPNPGFRPSSHEEEVFHSMEGRIWVDPQKRRLAEIDGHLTTSVKFGGGLLGYLDKGGEFRVKQSEVAPGYWEITLMHVDMRGKALFFKTISVQQNELHTNFQRLPDDLTLAQGANELRQQLRAANPQK